ncbi:hypothetical protein ONZ45_g16760 [Pleurotus djamor]|nr:hypothetical protein ONZ45_g16760 [Pleurotus djamor]
MAPSQAQKARTVKRSKGEPPRKRGNKGDFHGRRLEYLDNSFAEYFAASEANTVGTWYTQTLFPTWFSTFPWYTSLADEVPEGFNVEEGEAKLDQETLATKEETKNSLRTKIKSWFNYQRTVKGAREAENAWKGWLNQLREADSEFKSEVAAAFDQEWPALGLPAEERVNKRREIAERLLSLKSDAVKKRIHEAADAQYKAAMEEWGKGAWREDVTDPVERAQAIASLSQVVQPLLDGIRSMTGLYVGMFAAEVPPEATFLPDRIRGVYVESGNLPGGKTFPTYDARGFQLCSKLFARFALATANGDGSKPEDSYLELLKDVLPAQVLAELASKTVPAETVHVAPPPIANTAPPPQIAAAEPPLPIANTIPHPVSPEPDLLQRAVSKIREAFESAGKGGCVGEEFLLELANLPLDEQATRVRRLCSTSVSEYEVTRESNIARKNHLCRQLGFSDLAFPAVNKRPAQGEEEEHQDDAEYQPDAAQKRRRGNESGAVRRSTRTTRVDGQVSGHNRSEGSGSQRSEGAMDEDETATAATSHGSSPSTPQDFSFPLEAEDPPASPPAQAASSTLTPSTHERPRPKWFANAWKAFTDGENQGLYGRSWLELLALWESIEKSAGYEEKKGIKLRQSTKRPIQVYNWIRSARYYHRQPPIPKLDAFASSWWHWWAEINPSWRERSNDGKLTRSGDGDWSDLIVPGVNGLLSVLVSLWWWRAQAASGSPALASWQDAIADVLWVLGQIADTL